MPFRGIRPDAFPAERRPRRMSESVREALELRRRSKDAINAPAASSGLKAPMNTHPIPPHTDPTTMHSRNSGTSFKIPPRWTLDDKSSPSPSSDLKHVVLDDLRPLPRSKAFTIDDFMSRSDQITQYHYRILPICSSQGKDGNYPNPLLPSSDKALVAASYSHRDEKNHHVRSSPRPPSLLHKSMGRSNFDRNSKVSEWLQRDLASSESAGASEVVHRLLPNLVQDVTESLLPELINRIKTSDHSSVQTRTSSIESSSTPGAIDLSKSQHQSKKKSHPSSSTSKRYEDPDGHDNEESDEDERRKRRKGKKPLREEAPKPLRCPFFSNDPEKYGSIAACSGGKGFPSIPTLM